MTSKGAILNPGDVVQDRYHILNQMDSGEFGNTFLAEDIKFNNRHYVLKIFASLFTDFTAVKKAQEVFEQGAGFVFRLQHSQIRKCRELLCFQKEEKQYLLLLLQDYVKGSTCQQLLEQRLRENKKINEVEIIKLLKNILPVLVHFHSMGVIHCNISPENIILRDEDQAPVLINFGCIKKAEKLILSQVNDKKKAVNQTVGNAFETASFAPREQVEQDTSYAHNDLYALAGTAVVLLTGKKPEQLVSLPQYNWNWKSEVNISPRLEYLLDKMLAPKVAERISTAEEVIKILDAISLENSFSSFSSAATTLAKKRLFPLALKAQIELLSLRQFFPRGIPLLSLLSLGLLITYIYPKQLEKILTVSAKSPEINHALNSARANNLGNSVRPKSLESRFSAGEKILIQQQFNEEKKTASQAFAQGDYGRAASLFSASLIFQPNDPEALIYFNNALISDKKSYTIAVPVPVGKNVNSAKEILRGVAQAQYQINQNGGINKIPLKIQVIDDDKSEDIAQLVAKGLGENPEILGVIGHYTSDMTLATAKIYAKSNLVAISPINSSVKLSNHSPNIFRTVPNDSFAARALAQHMKYKSQKSKVAIFYDSQSDHSESLNLEFRSAVSLVGGQVVDIFDLSDPNFDASRSLQQAIENGAEALMLSTNPNKLDKALEVIKVNKQRLELLGGNDIYTPKTLQIAMKSAKRMVVAVPWHNKNNPDSDFAEMAQNLWRGEISWRTAMAYDATQAWISALEDNQRPTRSKLQKTLANPGFSSSGVDRKIRFSMAGDRLADIQLVEIKPANNDFGYEFTPLVTSSPISFK